MGPAPHPGRVGEHARALRPRADHPGPLCDRPCRVSPPVWSGGTWETGRRAGEGTSVAPHRGRHRGRRSGLPGEPLRPPRTLFPLELYPKISAWGGLYKSHIEEFRDLRTAIARWGVGEVGGNLYWQLTY